MRFDDVVLTAAQGIELAGVTILVGGVIAMFARSLVWLHHGRPRDGIYQDTRRGLGRVLLLGIEVLVAGDIIRTVAIEPTLGSVGVLAGIVLIRTFLSWTIELETEGRWPWRTGRDVVVDAPVADDTAGPGHTRPSGG